MSYSFDGKISNQSPSFRWNSGNPKPTCECCQTLLDSPLKAHVQPKPDHFRNSAHEKECDKLPCYKVYSYIGTEYFIYETKKSSAVVYCSEYCRNKHNHRFTK